MKAVAVEWFGARLNDRMIRCSFRSAGDGAEVPALRATAANSTLVGRTRHHPRSRVRDAQIITILRFVAQIA